MSKGDISGGDFKTIVSGEPIMARHAYGRPFSADNLPLIIANVNEMPVTTSGLDILAVSHSTISLHLFKSSE